VHLVTGAGRIKSLSSSSQATASGVDPYRLSSIRLVGGAQRRPQMQDSRCSNNSCRIFCMPSSKDESRSELHARRTIEAAIERPLERIEPSPLPGIESPDYQTAGGQPCLAFEVKQVTVKAARELQSMGSKGTLFSSHVLAFHWTVIIQVPSLADGLSSAPSFPAVDHGTRQFFEAHGLHVMTPEDRIQEWKMIQANLRKRKLPRLKGIAEDIEADLKALEGAGLRTTRTDAPFETWGALSRIENRTHGALCIATEPRSGAGAIEICFGSGGLRTGRSNAIIDRVQVWLDNPAESKNLRKSLENHAEADERHGVLVIDTSLEPEWWSSQSDFSDHFEPTQPLVLGQSLDAMWLIMGDLAALFESRSDSWTVYYAPGSGGGTFSS